MKKPSSLADLAEGILDMYETLVGRPTVEAASTTANLLSRRLFLLRRLARADLGPDDLDEEQAITVQETLLDAVALQMATGGRDDVFSGFGVKDPALVGRTRTRRAKLLESDDAQLDWHFQLLVQAWAAAHSHAPVKDLQNDQRFRDRRACDFAIERPSGLELLEAKRFHPAVGEHDNDIASAISKLTARLPDALEQLTSTAAVIGKERCKRHLLVDVTAYGQMPRSSKQGGLAIEETGLAPGELKVILDAIEPVTVGLDKLTLCWNSYVKLDGRYRAIVHRTHSRLPANAEMLEYVGCTVEAYPLRRLEYRELRVSSVARDLSWLVASYNSLYSPETFSSIGPEVRVN